MNLHQKRHLEPEICARFVTNGWLYVEDGAARDGRQLGSFVCTLDEINAGGSEA